VPLNVSPLTVPEPDTEVTVPAFAVAPAAIPSNLVLSAALIEPAAEVVAAEIEITGAAPPLEAIGAVPVTPVTVPVFPVRVTPLAITAPATDIEVPVAAGAKKKEALFRSLNSSALTSPAEAVNPFSVLIRPFSAVISTVSCTVTTPVFAVRVVFRVGVVPAEEIETSISTVGPVDQLS
jgi:hypothetical protein